VKHNSTFVMGATTTSFVSTPPPNGGTIEKHPKGDFEPAAGLEEPLPVPEFRRRIKTITTATGDELDEREHPTMDYAVRFRRKKISYILI
jgi:hypothetical protein